MEMTPEEKRIEQGALEYAVGYRNERKVGDKTLADLQGLQWKVADMATQLEGARLLMQRAVHMAGPHGTPPALETARYVPLTCHVAGPTPPLTHGATIPTAPPLRVASTPELTAIASPAVRPLSR